MNLGTIAHLQYYFARTGLLDGKGGQLYSSRSKDGKHSGADLSGGTSSTFNLAPKLRSDSDSTYGSMRSSPDPALQFDQETSLDGSVLDSPIQEEYPDDIPGQADTEPMMLPPTVSTYNYRPKQVPRPPTMEEMRRDLRHALAEAAKVLKDAEDEEIEQTNKESSARPVEDTTGAHGIQIPSAGNTSHPSDQSPPVACEKQGWYEIQGMHILDLMTLAIRAAKIYYTAHEQPGRLSAIKSERKIREELLTVMDTLKRMATRNFTGGMKTEERQTMQDWIVDVEHLLQQEDDQEEVERRERESWSWLLDDWEGRAHDREFSFLKSFDACPGELPRWTSPDSVSESPTPFLRFMRDGVRLVRLHNSIVAKSKRPFGQITTFHTDTMKPYRCADNLRFWIKAAELRWEIVLKVDVMGVVYGRDAETWRAFDREMLRWCAKVREELAAEWKVKASKGAGPDSLEAGKAGDGPHSC